MSRGAVERVHSRGEPGGPGRIVRRRMVLGGRVEGYSGSSGEAAMFS